MLNLFEQPWTLLILAVAIFFVTLIIRRIVPEKCPWWQLLLPVLLSIAAFGLDWLVETDTEKIKKLINVGIKAVEEENSDGIDAIISADYHDSYHNTKEDLMRYCRSLLNQPLVDKNIRRYVVMRVSVPEATAFVTVWTVFDKESYVYEYQRNMLTKLRLNLKKQQDKSWLINRAEILEVNNQRAGWKHIK